MSTAERVFAMLQTMPGADVQVVFDVTKALYEKQKSPLAPMTREELLHELEVSRFQAAQGEWKPALEAVWQIASTTAT